jgi:hypothetical protein
MRRAKLLSLEKQGLVQETHGYGPAFTLNGVDGMPSSENPLQDEKLRVYMMRKSRDEAEARARRISRLRLLARMDYKLLGGVAATGFNGGAGGTDSLFRSTSSG